MQLDELYTEIDDEIGLVIDDYLPGDCSATDTHRLMAQLDDESVLDLRKCAVALSPCGAPEDLDQSMSPRGMRLLARVTGLNDETAIAMSNYFGELTKVQGATLSDLLVVPGVTTVQAQAIKDTLARVVEATIMVQYNWVLGLSHHRSGSLPDWVLAIDFGTSFTVAAAKVDGRPAEVIEIAGERRMPSVVLIDAETVMVGRVAEDLSGTNPKRVVRALKNRLGDQAPLILDGRPHQVVALVAIVLRHVYDEAVSQLHRSPSEVRLTHPATWNRPRLNRLLEAAAKAGLPNPVLVPEPVAAALSFASEMGIAAGACIAVYDLGGGTFDSAVVTSSAGGFQVIGRPGGDQHIGGELFDEILVNRLGERLAPADWTALQTDADPVWQRVASTLRNEARRAKETLSVSTYADLIVPLPAGLMEVRVQRQEYEDLIRPYIAETVVLLERCVAEAGIDSRRLAGISLAGGASRTPMVETQVTEAFRAVPLIRRADPKTAVAIGAAAFDRPATQPRPSLGNRTTQGAATTPPGPLSPAATHGRCHVTTATTTTTAAAVCSTPDVGATATASVTYVGDHSIGPCRAPCAGAGAGHHLRRSGDRGSIPAALVVRPAVRGEQPANEAAMGVRRPGCRHRRDRRRGHRAALGGQRCAGGVGAAPLGGGGRPGPDPCAPPERRQLAAARGNRRRGAVLRAVRPAQRGVPQVGRLPPRRREQHRPGAVDPVGGADPGLPFHGRCPEGLRQRPDHQRSMPLSRRAGERRVLHLSADRRQPRHPRHRSRHRGDPLRLLPHRRSINGDLQWIRRRDPDRADDRDDRGPDHQSDHPRCRSRGLRQPGHDHHGLRRQEAQLNGGASSSRRRETNFGAGSPSLHASAWRTRWYDS